MLNKYIIYSKEKIIMGQDARTKEWYCKELPTEKETMKGDIEHINDICNKINKKEKRPPTPPKKEKKEK